MPGESQAECKGFQKNHVPLRATEHLQGDTGFRMTISRDQGFSGLLDPLLLVVGFWDTRTVYLENPLSVSYSFGYSRVAEKVDIITGTHPG